MRSWTDFLQDAQKLEPGLTQKFRERPKVSVVGCFQNGKSTFINCLLGQLIARPGDGHATTKISTRYRWGETLRVQLRTPEGLKSIALEKYLKQKNISSLVSETAFQVEVSLKDPLLKNIELIDTPGFNADEDDTDTVIRSLGETNYAVVILTNKRAIGQSEQSMFEHIRSAKIPYIVVMNCLNSTSALEWFPSHKKNLRLIRENEALLTAWGHSPERIKGHTIYPCNFLWYLFALDNRELLSHSLDADDLEELPAMINLALLQKQEIPRKENILRLSNFVEIKTFFRDWLQYI